jgi:hypothetical protein
VEVDRLWDQIHQAAVRHRARHPVALRVDVEGYVCRRIRPVRHSVRAHAFGDRERLGRLGAVGGSCAAWRAPYRPSFAHAFSATKRLLPQRTPATSACRRGC